MEIEECDAMDGKGLKRPFEPESQWEKAARPRHESNFEGTKPNIPPNNPVEVVRIQRNPPFAGDVTQVVEIIPSPSGKIISSGSTDHEETAIDRLNSHNPIKSEVPNLVGPGETSPAGSDGTNGLKGRRGQRPPRPTAAERADYVCTRPPRFEKSVTGQSGLFKEVDLTTNFFRFEGHEWTLYQYHVEFCPGLERTCDKRVIFTPHRTALPCWNVYDGSTLYTSQILAVSHLQYDTTWKDQEMKVRLKMTNEVEAADPVRFQIYNIVIRACMRQLKLLELNRNYYDDSRAVRYADVGIEIWPGFKTSIRKHELGLLLCVDLTNRVLRKETAWDVIQRLDGDRERINQELLGVIVMTAYNKRSYRIDDINWDESPKSTFSLGDDGPVSYEQYLQDKYNIQVKVRNQPILCARLKRQDIRKGMTGNVCLVPEMCLMTGLRDDQRKNFNLMKRLNEQLQMSPTDRVKSIRLFNTLLEQHQVRQTVLESAGLQLNKGLIRFKGHAFNSETLLLGVGRTVTPTKDRYDWSGDLARNQMCTTIDLRNWALVSVQGVAYETFVEQILEGARSMNFRVNRPCLVKEVRRGRDQLRCYLNAIDEIVCGTQDLQMIMCIVPQQDETLYAEIKRKCYLDYGIASQCVLQKNISAPAHRQHIQRGVAQKLAIQMNTKLGGVPWKIKIPPKGLMVIGFNVSSSAAHRGSNKEYGVGAIVASLRDDQTKFYSSIVDHETGQTLSGQIVIKISQAIHAYKREIGSLPLRIIFYRDGVGEGQLQAVVNSEVQEIRNQLQTTYGENVFGFAFIVVNKRTNVKFFTPRQGYQPDFGNPEPGTAVDDVVTLPERYDFYLISAKGTGQGTVSPTSYNVIYDSLNWKPMQVQLLTYKLCHLYFNWSSTVRVPAVCQYAHKLAALQSMIKKSRRGETIPEPRGNLCSTLFYL